MAAPKTRRRRRSTADNPRGYIKYRGRLIASAPYYGAGRVVPKRRRRSRRSLNNPLFRTRKGRYTGRKTSRRLHRVRPSGWRVMDNPRRRISRRRRSRRSNPVYYSNPRHSRRRMRLLANPLEAVKKAFTEAFSGNTLETVFQTGLGFGVTLIGSKLVYRNAIPAMDTPVGRVGASIGVGILGSALLGMVGGPALAVRALAGGLLATVWQGVSEAVKGTAAADFIPTLGEPAETEAFRKAIESEVLKEIRGGKKAGAEGVSVYIQPAGVQEYYLTAAGTQAYLTQNEGDAAAGVSTYLTEREMVAAGVGDEFGSKGMPEKF